MKGQWINLAYYLWLVGMGMTFGYAIAIPTPTDEINAELARRVIYDCQKDLPRSQVCELSAKVKEGKE